MPSNESAGACLPVPALCLCAGLKLVPVVQRQKDGEDRHTYGMLGASLQAAAAVACYVYDAVEATAAQQPPMSVAIGQDGSIPGGSSRAEAKPGTRIEASEVAKAAFVLIHRATACETPAGSCMTAIALWALLLLSEMSVVSQWTVAMVACVASFCTLPLLVEFGDVLDQLSATVLRALPLLWLPGLRRKWVISFCVGCGVLWWTPGAAVLRTTGGVIAFMSSLLWQMQGSASPASTERCHQQ